MMMGPVLLLAPSTVTFLILRSDIVLKEGDLCLGDPIAVVRERGFFNRSRSLGVSKQIVLSTSI